MKEEVSREASGQSSPTGRSWAAREHCRDPDRQLGTAHE